MRLLHDAVELLRFLGGHGAISGPAEVVGPVVRDQREQLHRWCVIQIGKAAVDECKAATRRGKRVDRSVAGNDHGHGAGGYQTILVARQHVGVGL